MQSLAVLDARVGKNRLQKLDSPALHPLAQLLLKVRLDSESLPIPEGIGCEQGRKRL
jgi:hypothetical protein